MENYNKSLAKNSIFNVLYKTLNIIFPLITSIYVARVLLADSIGKIAAAQNLVSYFTIIAAMGIPTYGIKIIAQHKIKSQELNKAFTELFIINMLLTVFSSIAYLLIIFLVPFYNGKELIYSITGVTLLFNIINVDWFYQGIQEYGYITIRSLVIKCVSLIALFIFVKRPDDYIIYAIISTCALVGNYFFNIIRLKKYISLVFKDLEFKKHLKHIFALFIASFAAEVYVLADTTMLDVMCGSEIVGYYTISMRIMRILRGIVVAISAVFLPQLSNYYYNGENDKFITLANKGIHILLSLSIPAFLGIAIVSDDAIITLFGSEYGNSINATRVLAISIVSVALSNYIGLQLLVILGKERITTISTIVGAFVNILLNYFLIVSFQHFGAAIASAITELCVTLIQIILVRKYIKLKYSFIKPVVSGAIMSIFVVAIHMIPISVMIRLGLECVIGFLVYYFAMLVLKDNFVITVTETSIAKVKKILKRGNDNEL